MTQELIEPRPNDVRFDKYREPGDPGCLCSRCLAPIGEKTHPLTWFAQSGKFVFMYHPVCLGIESFDFDEEDLEDWEEGDRP